MSETIELVEHTCNNCGPKAACLFAPSELKKKTSYCLKCIKERRKKHLFPNPFPADSVIIFGYKDRRK